jgi:hypothetical protein
MRHAFPAIKAAILLRRPIVLIAPRLKSASVRLAKKTAPRAFEPQRAQPQASRPLPIVHSPGLLPGSLPRVGTIRIASAERNRADLHVAVGDLPALRESILRSAASWDGMAHDPPNRPAGEPLGLVTRNGNCPRFGSVGRLIPFGTSQSCRLRQN